MDLQPVKSPACTSEHLLTASTPTVQYRGRGTVNSAGRCPRMRSTTWDGGGLIALPCRPDRGLVTRKMVALTTSARRTTASPLP